MTYVALNSGATTKQSESVEPVAGGAINTGKQHLPVRAGVAPSLLVGNVGGASG